MSAICANCIEEKGDLRPVTIRERRFLLCGACAAAKTDTERAALCRLDPIPLAGPAIPPDLDRIERSRNWNGGDGK